MSAGAGTSKFALSKDPAKSNVTDPHEPIHLECGQPLTKTDTPRMWSCIYCLRAGYLVAPI